MGITSILKDQKTVSEYRNATLLNDRIYLSFNVYGKQQFNDELSFIHTLPGREYHAEIKKWSVPVNRYVVKTIIDKGYKIDESIKTWRYENREIKIAIEEPENIKLYEYQKEGIAMLEQLNGRALLADEMGLGKEQPISEPILTPFGWKTIGEMKRNDYVIGSDGKRKKVINIYPQGIKDVYEITFSDKTKVRCGLEHLWTVRDGNMTTRNKGWKTIPLSKIIDMGIKLKNGNSKFEIPYLKNPVEYQNNNIKLFDPYLMGLIISNGSCTSSPISITINENDLDVMKRIGGDWKKKTGCYVKSIHKAIPIIKNLKLNIKSKDKFIPSIYKFSSVNDRKELLRGLMDGDGSNIKNRITYHTISELLANDVAEIIRSLGGIAIIRKYERHDGKPIEYQVNVKTNFCPFFSKRKSTGWAFDKRIIGNRITDVKKIGKEESVCIKIDSEDHLYVTANFKLTHNTCQVITYLKRNPQIRPAVIIVPASLKINWHRELNKFGLNEDITIVNGKKSGLSTDENIVIINYDLLNDYLDLIEPMQPSIIILDESHYIKNIKAKRTRAVKYLAKNIKHIICISGTPIVNRPSEFFTTLNLLAPDMFNSWYRYADEYCGRPEEGYKGARNTERLNKILMQSFMIRRLKADVLKELPPKIRSIIPFEITNRAEYEKAENDLIQYLLETEGRESAIKASMAEALVRFEKLKQITVNGKIDQVIEWIENFIEAEKLVVFCVHHSTIDALMKHFKDIAVKLDGRDTQKARQESIDKFQKNSDTRLFIGNIKAAGVGITLTAASNVAFIELDWVPGYHDQAEDRCHRIGTTADTVNAYYLLGLNTIEEELAMIIDEKRKILTSILDGEEPDDKALITILIENYRNKK